MNQLIVRTILVTFPWVVAGLGVPTVAIAAPPNVEAGPPPTPPVPEQCVPACRAGYLCVQGQCVSSCNPPCAANEICAATGQCIAAAPAPAAVAQPPAGQPNPAVPTQPGSVPPAAQNNIAPMAPSTEPAESDKASSDTPRRRFGETSQLAISAENLFGYAYGWANLSVTQHNGASVSSPQLSWNSGSFSFLGSGGNFNYFPGIAADFVIGSGFTAGGAFYYASTGGDYTVTQGTTTTTATKRKNDGASTFEIAARAGYVLMFNDIIGIWPRVGFGYQSATQSGYSYSGTNNQTETESDLNASVFTIRPEFMMVISPVPHFALLLGVATQVGVTGSATVKSGGTTTYEADCTANSIALSGGLMGYF